MVMAGAARLVRVEGAELGYLGRVPADIVEI